MISNDSSGVESRHATSTMEETQQCALRARGQTFFERASRGSVRPAVTLFKNRISASAPASNGDEKTRGRNSAGRHGPKACNWQMREPNAIARSQVTAGKTAQFFNERVAEWLKAPDCKLGSLWIHKFESCLAHQF